MHVVNVFCLPQVYIVDYTGQITEAPEQPELLGHRPWELCSRLEDRERLFAAFVQACMLRRPQIAVRSNIRVTPSGGLSKVIEFDAWLTPCHQSASVMVRACPPPAARLTAAKITQCERVVLKLVCCGNSNAAIASDLGVAESTVRKHLANLREKLGVTRGEQLIANALGFEPPRDWCEESINCRAGLARVNRAARAKQHTGNQSTPDPTPEEIAAACETIRAAHPQPRRPSVRAVSAREFEFA